MRSSGLIVASLIASSRAIDSSDITLPVRLQLAACSAFIIVFFSQSLALICLMLACLYFFRIFIQVVNVKFDAPLPGAAGSTGIEGLKQRSANVFESVASSSDVVAQFASEAESQLNMLQQIFQKVPSSSASCCFSGRVACCIHALELFFFFNLFLLAAFVLSSSMSCCSSCWLDRVSLCFFWFEVFVVFLLDEGCSWTLRFPLVLEDPGCMVRDACTKLLCVDDSCSDLFARDFFLAWDASICFFCALWLSAFDVVASSASCVACLFLHFMI